MSDPNLEWKTIGQLYIRPAVNIDGNKLGWAVSVLIDDGDQAEFFVLRHCIENAEALTVKRGILNFLATQRSMLAKLACSTWLWKWIAFVLDGSEMCWKVIEHDALPVFRNGPCSLCYAVKNWHSNLPSSFSRWLERYSWLSGQ